MAGAALPIHDRIPLLRHRDAEPRMDTVPRMEAEPARSGPTLWHRLGQSGALRASVFGVSDGLVSNLALVIGVAGAETDGRFVVLAGLAGLLAGAFSMGAGEWISMTSQRELFQREIELVRARWQRTIGAAEDELAHLYRRKGIDPSDATRLASVLAADRESALDTILREELGLDPGALGSPWSAALGSFLSFTAGALVPLVPYLLGRGTGAYVAAVVLSVAALIAVGGGVSLVTGRRPLVSAIRQVAAGLGAAAVTFAVGTAIGGEVMG